MFFYWNNRQINKALNTEILYSLNPSFIYKSRSNINKKPGDVISTFELQILSPFLSSTMIGWKFTLIFFLNFSFFFLLFMGINKPMCVMY